MNLADCPTGAMRVRPDIPLPRQQLEAIALACARREHDLRELTCSIERQQETLVELRRFLLRTLWPRPPVA